MLPATLAILSSTFRGRERADRVRGVGRDGRGRRRVRPGRRRVPHHQLLVALGVPDQRDRRPARDHRRAAVHEARRARRQRGCRIDVPGAVLIAVGHVPARVRAQRGRHATAGGSRSRTSRSAGDVVWPATAPVSIIPLVFVVAVVLLVAFYLARALRRSARNATRCSSSATCASRTYRYGLLTGAGARDGPARRSASCSPCSCRTASTSPRGRTGCWLLPSGIFVIVGAQLGGRLIHRFGTTSSCGVGLVHRTRSASLLILRRGVARHARVGAAARPRALRHRHRLRGRAAHERRALGDPAPRAPAWRAARTRPCARSAARSASRSSARCSPPAPSRRRPTASEALALPGRLRTPRSSGSTAVGTSFAPPGVATSGQAAELRRVVQDGLAERHPGRGGLRGDGRGPRLPHVVADPDQHPDLARRAARRRVRAGRAARPRPRAA